MVTEEEHSNMELESEMVPVPQVQDQSQEQLNQLENQDNKIPRQKPRPRKNELNAKILKQMEFYFSDANLSKDRFLGDLVKKDPYIDIQEFFKFNRIQSLTDDVSRIAKALRPSSMLEVSEDGTKVRRITPISPRENSDECTIYVQRLPLHTDHEMLISIFSKYGPVVYVSIPKYKVTRNIKGFAFVEFETPEDAAKCIKAMEAKGCLLPSQTASDTILSITTFAEDKEMIENAAKKGKNDDIPAKKTKKRVVPEEPETGETEQDGPKSKKKKRDKSENGESSSKVPDETEKNGGEKKPEAKKRVALDEPETCEKKDESSKGKKKKKNESENETEEAEDKVSEKVEKKSKKKKLEESVEGSDDKVDEKIANVEENAENMKEDDENEKESNEKGEKKKKLRKHRKCRKSEKMNATDMGLEIMTKKEWKRLRNKYLELQRSKMHQLKQYLKRAHWNKEKSRMEREENEEKTGPKQLTGIRNLPFTPGLIVKIEMNETCTDPKSFKMELKGNNAVKYIDVSEGSSIAHVRFDSVEAANDFAQKSSAEKKMAVIKDEEEKSYWYKMQEDRNEKVGKNVKRQRGKTKMLKKAEKELGKHIRFDEV